MALVTQETGVPVHDDGSEYALAMVLPTGVTAFADTYDDLVAEMIEDYPEDIETPEDADRAALARIASASAEADVLQERFMVDAAEGGFLGEGVDPMVARILTHPRSQHIALPGNRWDVRELPLVLVTTHYSPHTNEPMPEGEAIVWIDPVTTRTYVQSMCAAAGIPLLENPRAESPDGEDEQDEAGGVLLDVPEPAEDGAGTEDDSDLEDDAADDEVSDLLIPLGDDPLETD